MEKQFSLYHKLYQLIKILYRTVKNFPKEHKYSLGGEILELSWQCLDLTIEANTLPNDRKAPKISELSANFDRLKMRIRMGQEIKLLSPGQFAHLEENYILEIGREIGGWSRWAVSRQTGQAEMGKKIGGGGLVGEILDLRFFRFTI